MNGKIVLRIPISLNTREDIATALVSKYGTDYVFIGRVFRSTIGDESCEIDICSPSEEAKELAVDAQDEDEEISLRSEFAFVAGIDEPTLEQIDRCQQIIYLTSTEVGYQACLQMAQLTQVLLQIGGLAVKLESADVAHSRSKWLSNYDSDDVFDICSLYVTLIEGEEYYYSCGMHHFGKADVAIALSESISLAIYVMNVFNYYRLTESPILQDGHTFRPDIECPQYVMKWIADLEYPNDSHCYNPNGRWFLRMK